MDFLLLVLGVIFLLIRKTPFSIAIMFALLTGYFGLGSNLSLFIFRHNVDDCGLILFFILLLSRIVKKRRFLASYRKNKKLSVAILVFTVFLSLTILYDIVVRGTGLTSVIKTYRHWLLLIFAIPFTSLFENKELKKSVDLIFVLSVIASVVILLSNYFHFNLQNKEDVLFYYGNNGLMYERGAIPTTFCVFFTLLVLTNYYKLKPFLKYFIFTIFFLTIVLSMIRSMLLASISGILIVFSYINKMKIRNILAFGIIAAILSALIYNSEGLVSRINEGFEEISSLEHSETSDTQFGTLAFRLDLLAERADYVASSLDRFILGIGAITETDFKPIFNTGLDDAQLDTGDIAWPLLLLRLGYIGTALFIFIWICFSNALFKSNSMIGKTGWVFLLVNILLSFCDSSPAKGHFWLFVMVILAISNCPVVVRVCNANKQ